MSLWAETNWACAALVTPIDQHLRIDVGRLAQFARRVLTQGLNGVVPFGTMGEGPAFPASERLEATARLIEAGLDPARMVLGIGSASLSEMAWLARRAAELKVAAVLATPPFFFREVTQEGVYRSYATLVEAAGANAPPLLLYHIPQVAGVRIEVETVARLIDAFPEKIKGIKDSEGKRDYTESLLEALADRTAVLVGSEELLPTAMTMGARGTVCGMANLIPKAVAALVHRTDATAIDQVHALGEVLAKVPVIPSVKAAVGTRLGDAVWRACIPPLLAATDEQARVVSACATL